jgi:predicted AlkP superfamily pyrophosphatase or phosphodiesterase
MDGCQVDALNKVDSPEATETKKRALIVDHASTIYPSLTGPGHASILTGVQPAKHGLVSHMYWDWSSGIHNIYSDQAFEAPTIFELLSKRGFKSEGHGNYFRKGITDSFGKKTLKWVANRAEKSTLITNTLESMPGFEKFLKKSVAGTVERLDEKVADSDAPLHYVLDNRVDKASHKHGPNSTDYSDAIRTAMANLLGLMNALDSRKQEYVIFVTSDHGHTTVDDKVNGADLDLSEVGLPIKKSEVINANLIVEYGSGSTDAVAVVVSRHIQVYLRDKSKTAKVTEALMKKRFVDKLLVGQQIAEAGVANQRTGDIIGGFKDNIGFVELPIGEKGDHGGFTEKEMLVPLWVIGSKVKPGTIQGGGTVDIAPTIFSLLGTDEARFDGKPINIHS